MYEPIERLTESRNSWKVTAILGWIAIAVLLVGVGICWWGESACR